MEMCEGVYMSSERNDYRLSDSSVLYRYESLENAKFIFEDKTFCLRFIKNLRNANHSKLIRDECELKPSNGEILNNPHMSCWSHPTISGAEYIDNVFSGYWDPEIREDPCRASIIIQSTVGRVNSLICTKLEANKFSLSHGFCEYVSQEPSIIEFGPWHKREKYRHQFEYRYVVNQKYSAIDPGCQYYGWVMYRSVSNIKQLLKVAEQGDLNNKSEYKDLLKRMRDSIKNKSDWQPVEVPILPDEDIPLSELERCSGTEVRHKIVKDEGGSPLFKGRDIKLEDVNPDDYITGIYFNPRINFKGVSFINKVESVRELLC